MTPDRLTTALADRYRIERELGQGGMATVYLAEDLKHHRQVAVKVLRPELAATMGSERFAREIEVAARLVHPHILGLLDSGDVDGFFYYVMPYVEGETLRDRIARSGELPVHEAVRLLGEIADALAVAHKAGVVHRDIKPENILLSGRHAMVMDFGVAKAVTEASGRQQLTTAGVALGTPAYMAPEQAAAEPGLDHRVDIYAVGVLGYELLTGQPPFTGRTAQQLLAAHVTRVPEPIAARRPSIPPALAAAIMKCLEKRPADRFQSADELVAVLEPLATPSGGMTPTHTQPIQAVAVPAGSPRRLAIGVGAGVLVAVLAWAGWRTLRSESLSIEFANIRQVTREAEPEIHVALSPDGREVAYESGYSGSTHGSTHIVVRDVTGGRPLPVTGDWLGGQERPRWMPDGRSIIFLNRWSTADHAAGNWKLPRLGGQAVAVDSVDYLALNHGHTIVQRGDTLFAGSADGTETRLRIRTGQEHSLAWRMDGRTAAYDRFVLRRNILAIPIPRSGSVSLRDGRAVTTGSQTIEQFDLSADGKWLTFDSNLDGRQDIYVMPATGGEPRRVTRDPGDDFGPDFSPDGREIAFYSTRNGTRDIYLINADGSGEKRLTSDAEESAFPAFSPDGLSIAYHKGISGTSFMLHRDGLAAPWQAAVRLPFDNARPVSWSPDGARLVFTYNGNPNGVWVTALDGTPQIVNMGGTAGLRSRCCTEWSADGQRIYFRAVGPDDVEGVYEVAASGGTPRLLVRFDDPRQSVFPSMDEGGNGMLYFAVGEVESDIYVMDLVRK